MVDGVSDWGRVGKRIAAEMSERAWTPNDVYRRAKVDPKTLARVIDGNRPRGDAARRLARVFGWRDDGLSLIAAGRKPVPAVTDTDRLSAVEAELVDIREKVEEVVRRLDGEGDPA